MIYLIFLIISLILFLGFFALTMVEARTGTRMFNPQRSTLDKRVGRIFFVVRHVDWGAFFSHLIQSFFARVAHDIAHLSLIIVRFVERQLTALVRTLRNRRPNVLAPKPSRVSPLEQTILYMQAMLRRAPKMKDPPLSIPPAKVVDVIEE